MLKANFLFYLLRYCLLLACMAVFPQTEIYKSEFKNSEAASPVRPMGSNQELPSSFVMSSDKILFNTNYNLYAIDKTGLKLVWESYVGSSTTIPYVYGTTFFYSSYKNGMAKVVQYDLNTGAVMRELPFESIESKPYFANDVMYCTAIWDGGKLLAYRLKEDKIAWQKNIGHGADFEPVYLKDKIIANAEDDNWFETDYNGNVLKGKSKTRTFIDTVAVFVKHYQFLTHDGKEISSDFLRKNKIAPLEYQIKKSGTHTFILSETQLLVLGNNRKKVLQLYLEKEFPTDNFAYDAYSALLETNPESVWFFYQNQLLHYDFKNKKNLRAVDLTAWNLSQIALEGSRIWLLSKNDGQLYGLDFEPDKKTADWIAAKAKMHREINNPQPPDPKKIEAAKAAQEKLKNKN